MADKCTDNSHKKIIVIDQYLKASIWLYEKKNNTNLQFVNVKLTKIWKGVYFCQIWYVIIPWAIPISRRKNRLRQIVHIIITTFVVEYTIMHQYVIFCYTNGLHV